MARRNAARWAIGVAIAGTCIAVLSAASMIAAGYLLDEQRIPPISIVPLFISLGLGIAMSIAGASVLVVATHKRGP